MADRNGYIGRIPGDSSVVVARQVFNPTSSTTNFTLLEDIPLVILTCT